MLGRSPEAVEVLHRMGKINEDMLQDVGTAKGWYAEALRINPDHLTTLRALRGIHESEQDWDAYEQVLAAEARAADDPAEKAQAELALARFHSERREDVAAATHWYEEATRHQPDLLDAALPLADLYIARESWDRAEAMLEVVVRQLRLRAAAEPEGRRRQGAVPPGVPARLRGREAGSKRTVRSSTTSRPTSSTPPTFRRWRATPTFSCRRSATSKR